jgi:hypothetical protein
MIVKPALTLLLCATCLLAAEFWQSKPYTEWTDKETQKIQTNSPWSKQVSVTVVGGRDPDAARGRRGAAGATGDLDSPLGSGGAGQHGQTQDWGAGATAPNMPAMVTVSWRSALPVREAVAREKYGDAAATAPDAKKMIEEPQKFYSIVVSGFPARLVRAGDKAKEAMLKNTSLSVKGRDPIAPADFQTGGNEQNAVVIFLFPRVAELSADDKEVEFSTRLGSMVVKQRFHLKEMVFNGKLEL